MQTLFTASFYIFFTLSASTAFNANLPTKRSVAVRYADVFALKGSLDDYGASHDDFDELREKLEALVGGDGTELTVFKAKLPEKAVMRTIRHEDIFVPDRPHPLTTIERERRETELAILQHLADGDEVLSDLRTFWYQERGPSGERLLLQAEALFSQRETWNQAELILRELIEIHGVHWTEPVNRLATLYYLQGRLEESEKMCLTVLKIKPWHIGALSGIVMVYAGMQASNEAREWAARRLPTFAPKGPNRRRQLWVERALSDAHESLHEAEKGLKTMFGDQDDEYKAPAFDDDVWQ